MYTPTWLVLTHSYITFNGHKFHTSSNCMLNGDILEPINQVHKPPQYKINPSVPASPQSMVVTSLRTLCIFRFFKFGTCFHWAVVGFKHHCHWNFKRSCESHTILYYCTLKLMIMYYEYIEWSTMNTFNGARRLGCLSTCLFWYLLTSISDDSNENKNHTL
jgi:hypothetical protein